MKFGKVQARTGGGRQSSKNQASNPGLTLDAFQDVAVLSIHRNNSMSRKPVLRTKFIASPIHLKSWASSGSVVHWSRPLKYCPVGILRNSVLIMTWSNESKARSKAAMTARQAHGIPQHSNPMAANPESPLDLLWKEYSLVFQDFDDLTLARWLAQTLGQIEGKAWRLSHALLRAYQLAAQLAHERSSWL